MSRLFAIFALVLMTLPIAAQTKPLVQLDGSLLPSRTTIPTAVHFQPLVMSKDADTSSCFKAEPGMVEPLFRLASQGAVEAEFDTSGEFINRYAVRPDGGVIKHFLDLTCTPQYPLRRIEGT